MRKFRVVLFLSALLVVVLAGCAGSLEQRLVGQYNGEVTINKTASNDPMAKMAEGLANAFAQGMSLELKEDKTFKMTMMMVPLEGKWAVDGGKLTLKADKVMGMEPDQLKGAMGDNPQTKNVNPEDVKKPMVFKVSDDAKTLTAEGETQAGSLIFKRKE